MMKVERSWRTANVGESSKFQIPRGDSALAGGHQTRPSEGEVESQRG